MNILTKTMIFMMRMGLQFRQRDVRIVINRCHIGQRRQKERFYRSMIFIESQLFRAS